MTELADKTEKKPSGVAPAAPPRDPVRSRLPFTLGLITMVFSLCSGLATYAILTGLTPIVPTHLVVVGVLLINLVLVLAMLVIIAWQVGGLWLARRRQVAGAQLHARVVSLFSVIAVVPAILLAVFASVSLDRGLDHWFSVRTKSIIQNSIDVATAYLQEHGQVIRDRHARHGQGHRPGGRAGALAAARLRHVPERAGLDQGAAHGLSDRRRRQGAGDCVIDG